MKNQPIEDGNPVQNNLKRFKRIVKNLDVLYDPIYDGMVTTNPMHDEESSHQEGDAMQSDDEV